MLPAKGGALKVLVFHFLNQLRERQRWSGLGEERKLEEGSEKRRDRKQLQRSGFFSIETLKLLLKAQATFQEQLS